ncbi:RagB/SusD family nutrient uptake outer membrane protein [Confluentibacter sediminis]|uniref:RagB/SusD family nutrient uptake outer membrane protein n=1 Tax=Confluentibacter sediminis TaxID=2219045 RepID=UPI000DAD77DC|nr:RagB/SusD family nutrient uptake outer membrane protein [Confluentibacter sediminis]
MDNIQLRNIIVMLLAVFFTASSCSDFLEAELPKDQITEETVFQNAGAIESAVRGIYLNYGRSLPAGATRTQMTTALTSDEAYGYYTNSEYDYYARNAYDAESGSMISYLWNQYQTIYMANTIIEKVPGSTVLTEAVQRQYESEARFLRAIVYYYLVSTYGDVPLVLTTDAKVNALKPRAPKADIFESIVNDLEIAIDLVPEEFVSPHRADSKWPARAILARVYLDMENWIGAEAMATTVIEEGPFVLEKEDLHQVFKRGNAEIIFAPKIAGDTDGLLTTYALDTRPFFGTVSVILRDELIAAFEAGDERFNNWVDITPDGYYYQSKYVNELFTTPDEPEDLIELRLAEQFLIRAEARARQGNITGVNSAESDVNTIRERAHLGATQAVTQAEMIDAIMQERRVELFFEGHRWYDLKRTGQIDAVLGALKGTDWSSYKALWPIPLSEIRTNPKLVPNPGY